MCSFIWKHFLILSEPRQCFTTRRLWIKQRSSLVNPTIVTKLRFIRIKPNFFYIGRRRTTSFDENDTWVNQNSTNIMHLTREETPIAKRWTWQPSRIMQLIGQLHKYRSTVRSTRLVVSAPQAHGAFLSLTDIVLFLSAYMCVLVTVSAK